MAYNFDVSILNPLRFFQLSDNVSASLQTINYATFDANYQTRDFDKDFFARNIPNYDRQTTYCQPYQQGDVIRVQFLGLQNDGITNQYVLDLLNTNGQSVITATPTQGATPISGQYITEFNVPLINVPEGEYFAVIRYRKGVGLNFIYTYLISEPIDVKQSHPNTLLFEYENSYNTQGIIFEELSAPFHFRVHSALTELNPDSKFTTYEDEPLNLEMLSGTPFRLWTLGIGGNGNPIPQWVADKIERITLCDTLKIDGKLYTRNEGAKLEANRKQRTPLFSWKIALREKINDNNLYISDYQQNKIIVADYVEGAGTIYARDLVTTTTYQIRQFFNGYTGLLQYLNGAFKLSSGLGGTFGIDAEKRLVYTPSSTAEATQFATPSLKILPYTIELNVVANSGTDFNLSVTPPTGQSTTYAVQYLANNGAITYATTSSPFTLANTYATNQNAKIRIAFDKARIYEFTASNNIDLLTLSGYLTADCVEFKINSALLYAIENNIFKFLTATNTVLNFNNTALSQTYIDSILKWLYVTAGLQNSVVNLLQTPNVPCSDDVAKNIVPYLIARGLTIYTNNTFTPSAPVNIALPAITGTFNPGNYITASNGTWTGYPTPYYTRVWQYSTNGGATWNNFVPNETGTQYLLQVGDVGRLIRCRVTATNPSGTALATSNSILVTALSGSAPYPTALPVISGATGVGSLLTTTNGTWGGSLPITYTYQWLRNGVAIGGATSSTYTSVSADLNANIQCQVTATNANGANTGESNVIVPTQSPINVTPPIVYGNVNTGATLTAYEGDWTGNPAPTYTYNWQISTNGGGTWSNYSPLQTNQTKTVVSGDLGNSIRCQVTGTNVSGANTANSQQLNIPTVAVQRPENTVAPAITGTPSIGNTLTCSTGTWNGSPSSYAYQWKRGTTNIGTNSPNYTLVSADVDSVISCVVSATNAGGTEPATSNSIYAYDTDFYAVIAHAITNSYALPSTKQLQYFSTVVTELKSAGQWTIHDIFYVTYNDNSSGQSFARINWRNPSLYYLNPVSAPTWTANVGYTFNGTTQYLDTGFNPATNGVAYTLNSAGRYMWVQRPSTTTATLDGNANLNDNTMRMGSAATQHTINSGSTTPSAVNTLEGGFQCIVRTSSTDAFRATELTSATSAVNVTSTAITSANQWIGRSQASYILANAPVRFYAMGGAIPVADIFGFRSLINKLVNI